MKFVRETKDKVIETWYCPQCDKKYKFDKRTGKLEEFAKEHKTEFVPPDYEIIQTAKGESKKSEESSH